VSGSGLAFGYSSTVHVREVSLFAGAAVGSATISYPAHYAKNAVPQMGGTARLVLKGRTIFRGIVGHAPMTVDEATDEVTLVLFGDKWPMSFKIVGQVGIGTENGGDDGFKDVGFEIVFNRDGKPNKDPSALNFSTGSGAVFWTLKNIMQFLFDRYVSDDVARVAAGTLSTAYDKVPSDLNLVGQTALQAVDTVATLAGESWGLRPGSSYSQFVAVRRAAGTARKARIFRPRAGATAKSASAYSANAVEASASVRDCRDVIQAAGALKVKEHTYTSSGGDPLLTQKSSFKDKEYVTRYAVDVSKYNSHNLGRNLSSGSVPKPWLQHLLTRKIADGDAYVTATQIASTPALTHNEQLGKPVLWLSEDGTEAEARLCVGGVRIDYDNGLVDFKASVDLMGEVGGDPEEVHIDDWSTVEIWLTVATVLETPESAESDSGGSYLPASAYKLIQKPDLVQELRQDSWLPDLSSDDNNAISKLATGGEEEYVDISGKLEEAVAAELAASPEIETPLSAEFPFMPTVNIGDRLTVAGRATGATGNEVATQIRYRFEEGVPDVVVVSATNVVAAVEPERFLDA